MGHDTVGYKGIYYGHLIDLTLIFDFKKFIEEANKNENPKDVRKYNEERGLDRNQAETVKRSIRESWEKYLKYNESVFKGVDTSKMSLIALHDAYLATYNTEPMGNYKLVWGYNIGEPYKTHSIDLNIIIPSKKESEVEEHTLTMKFPDNSREIFLNFLESIKMTETPKSEIESFLRFGAYADVNSSWVQDEVEDRKRKNND